MDLSHQSITGQQFELNRRGYDPDAVDAHLAEIASGVQTQQQRLAELETTIVALEAKVRDADESEEALRLTLKAAAHAKEELLAGAREQAAATQADADAKAATVVGEAEEKARSLTQDAESHAQSVTSEAEARATALTSGASAQAREVAQAALAESELLVERIEQLRGQLEGAEDSLRALSAESNPRLQSARAVLDAALEQARASAENPELLAAAAAAPVVTAPAFPEPEPVTPAPAAEPDTEPVAEASDAPPITQPEPEAADPQASTQPESEEPPTVDAAAPTPEPAQPSAPVADAEVSQETEAEGAPHLEVVEPSADEPTESTADISDKVDRLLEELREVT